MTDVDTPTPNLMHANLPPSAPAPSAPAAHEPLITEIRPPGGWQLINFEELWHFRDLLYFLTWRDVQLRYKQTVLGVAWAVLQPVLYMVVFTAVFQRRETSGAGDSIPYPLFTYTGLVVWLFFSSAIGSAGNSVIGSEKLITKIYFPRLAIPFAAVGAAMVDAFVAFVLLCVVLPFTSVAITWQILMLPVVIAIVVLAAVGIGTFLAALNVNYRDIRYVIPFLLQVWMFATPSIYEDFSAPNKSGLYQFLIVANPMTGLVAAFRACLLGTEMPWGLLATAFVLSVVAFVVGCFYFRRMEDGFADVI